MLMNKSVIATMLAAAVITGCGNDDKSSIDKEEVSLDLSSLTIDEAKEIMTSGKVTTADLMSAHYDRIEQYEPKYNAFISLSETALSEAEDIDQRRKKGDELGVLAGIPIVLKDSIDQKGVPTTAGWSGFSSKAGGIDLIPEKDAPLVKRLRDAGAIIVGKTNLPVFAASGDNANNSFNGPTYNVLNRAWAPGGSSTGTATAVAAGFAIAGIAEETGGSIQNPASAQGLIGVKPTFGLVPNTGVVPLAANTRDVLGPITKSVRDAALILDVIAGYTPDDPKTEAALGKLPNGGYTSLLSKDSLKGARVGLYGSGWRSHNGELSEETKELYETTIAQLKEQGAIVIEDPFMGTGFSELLEKSDYDARGSEALPYDVDNYLKNLGASAKIKSLAELNNLLGYDIFSDKGPLFYFSNIKDFQPNEYASPDLEAFNTLRSNYLEIFNNVMRDNQLDMLVFPQQRKPIGDRVTGGISATTVSEINLSGLPLVTLPAGKYSTGQPYAIAFVGPMWSEAKLLGYAYDMEDAVGPRPINRNLEK